MGAGILVCGLNGAGKSTLGKALAEQLGGYFLDNEDLYFPKTDPAYLYAPPRTREEVEQLLWKELRTHENLEAVPIGDGMHEPAPIGTASLFLPLSKATTETRSIPFPVRRFDSCPEGTAAAAREKPLLSKFGSRMLPGGDLYEREQDFFAFAASRAENTVEEWISSLSCPVIRVDGTKPAAENAALIIRQMRG